MADTAELLELKRVNLEIAGSEEKDDFIISGSALEMIAEVKGQNEVPEEYFLRIGTRSGGCSGMNYMLGFDSETNPGDRVFELSENLKMIADQHSVFYLQGVTLEYSDNPASPGFLFNNPNNAHTCGCNH